MQRVGVLEGEAAVLRQELRAADLFRVAQVPNIPNPPHTPSIQFPLNTSLTPSFHLSHLMVRTGGIGHRSCSTQGHNSRYVDPPDAAASASGTAGG